MKAELVPLTRAQKEDGQFEKKAEDIENSFLTSQNFDFLNDLRRAVDSWHSPKDSEKKQLKLLYQLFANHAIADILTGFLQSSKSKMEPTEAKKYLVHYINRYLVSNIGILLSSHNHFPKEQMVLDRIGALALLARCYESHGKLQQSYARERDFASLLLDCQYKDVAKVKGLIVTPDHLPYWLQGRDRERIAAFSNDFAGKSFRTLLQMDFLGEIKSIDFDTNLQVVYVLMRDYSANTNDIVLRSPFSGQEVYVLARILADHLYASLKLIRAVG